jgi:predicted metal-dependent hydrolase
MEKHIELQNRSVPYKLKVSKSARALRLAVRPGGAFTVTAPRYLSWGAVEKFILQKSEWILGAIDKLSAYPAPVRKNKKAENLKYKEYKNVAQKMAEEKVAKFNQVYNFKYNNISIRNQKTRWGSCSRKGNLNFNYKIALIPEHLADYIIVHEICHLGQMNHSRNFWALVAKTIPDHKKLRAQLRKMGSLQ